jgi:hypothetical protein
VALVVVVVAVLVVAQVLQVLQTRAAEVVAQAVLVMEPLAVAVSSSSAIQTHSGLHQTQQAHQLFPHRVDLEFISSQPLAQLRFNS